jgi:hypothetical protein
MILRTHRLSPEETLIVGDNPSSEIAAGSRFGDDNNPDFATGVTASPAAACHIGGLAGSDH